MIQDYRGYSEDQYEKANDSCCYSLHYVCFPACGKNADNKTENNVNLTNNDVTTAQTEVTDEVPDETTSLPDRSTLEKIPDEAVDSFNQVVDVCKEIYPLAEKTKGFMVIQALRL